MQVSRDHRRQVSRDQSACRRRLARRRRLVLRRRRLAQPAIHRQRVRVLAHQSRNLDLCHCRQVVHRVRQLVRRSHRARHLARQPNSTTVLALAPSGAGAWSCFEEVK